MSNKSTETISNTPTTQAVMAEMLRVMGLPDGPEKQQQLAVLAAQVAQLAAPTTTRPNQDAVVRAPHALTINKLSRTELPVVADSVVDKETRALLFLPTSHRRFSLRRALRERFFLDENKIPGGKLLGLLQTFQGWRREKNSVLQALKILAGEAHTPEARDAATEMRQVMDGVLKIIAAENKSSLLYSKKDTDATDRLGLVLKVAAEKKSFKADKRILAGLILFASALGLMHKPNMTKEWDGEAVAIQLQAVYSGLQEPQKKAVVKFLAYIVGDLYKAVNTDAAVAHTTTEATSAIDPKKSNVLAKLSDVVLPEPLRVVTTTTADTTPVTSEQLATKLRVDLTQAVRAVSLPTSASSDEVKTQFRAKYVAIITDANRRIGLTKLFLNTWDVLGDPSRKGIARLDQTIRNYGIEMIAAALVLTSAMKPITGSEQLTADAAALVARIKK